jgi:hypothetical protein
MLNLYGRISSGSGFVGAKSPVSKYSNKGEIKAQTNDSLILGFRVL